jgi:hypothetical protein
MSRSPRNCVLYESGYEFGIEVGEREGESGRMKATHIVISGIFNSCDGEDKNQRHNGGEPRQGRDLWDQLEREACF